MSVTFTGGRWGTGSERLFLGPRSCLTCRHVVYEGHIDCNCEKNHPHTCDQGA